MKHLWLLIFTLWSIAVKAQPSPPDYPYPVHYFNLTIEQQPVQMAYMDVQPASPNGKAAVLLHGKNFNGYYWKNVIALLSDAGYRVVVPDQVGWGKSSKPDIYYNFHRLALNTKWLLDTLGIDSVIVIAHSMGGMLGSRFALMYPQLVTKLILEDPIGLEDYRTFVPYATVDELYQNELKATYQSIQNYQKSYYPEWKPEYEQYVAAQAASLQDSNYAATALANALTYQMIYEEPVVYELKHITVPTLLIVGAEDRTIVGKNRLTEEQKKMHGMYPVLAQQAHGQIQHSKLIVLPGVGHIPHIQTFKEYSAAITRFLETDKQP